MARFQVSGANVAAFGGGNAGLAEALSNRNLLRMLAIAAFSGTLLIFMAELSARPACSKTDAYVAGKLQELKTTPSPVV